MAKVAQKTENNNAKNEIKTNSIISLNEVERFLGKPAKSFTKKDIIAFVLGNNIEMLNFHYVGSDGRLKTLNFVINSVEYLDSILTTGERVDGSSLFDFIEASSSDLYVVPRYTTAFVDPFAIIPTLDMLCSFYDIDGNPLKSSPEYILRKAHSEFKKATGFTFKALGELEYYIYDSKDQHDNFPAADQHGYHESEPFTKFEHIRTEAMRIIAACGGQIKYGHSEVGNFTDNVFYYEQQEIEFLPCEAELAVEQMLVAKWVLRNICSDLNVSISFAPKITVGKAGSGLHIHMMLEKNGKNMMVAKDKLSDDAKKLIVGVLDLADAITAFGNTIPISYLRLVPHQEAPTNICWGDRNRSVLVRVPLGWAGKLNMLQDANPQDKSAAMAVDNRQTVEIRSGDSSADLYLYMASLIVAAQHGLQMKDALNIADKLYVNVNIFKEENKKLLNSLKALPASCYESAEKLEQKRGYFEKNGIFPKGLIDSTIKTLKSYNDHNMSERLYGQKEEIAKLVASYLNIK